MGECNSTQGRWEFGKRGWIVCEKAGINFSLQWCHIRAAGLSTLEKHYKWVRKRTIQFKITLAKGVSQDKNANKQMSYCSFQKKRPHSENMITLKVKQQDIFILASYKPNASCTSINTGQSSLNHTFIRFRKVGMKKNPWMCVIGLILNSSSVHKFLSLWFLIKLTLIDIISHSQTFRLMAEGLGTLAVLTSKATNHVLFCAMSCLWA